jgi:hypothetical protein
MEGVGEKISQIKCTHAGIAGGGRKEGGVFADTYSECTVEPFPFFFFLLFPHSLSSSFLLFSASDTFDPQIRQRTGKRKRKEGKEA